MTTIEGKKIVVTGVTGQVALPVAAGLAKTNEVYGAARYADPAARQRVEAAGVRPVRIDLAAGDVAELPADADYVLNFAVAKTNDWGRDLDASGGVASLMEHHRDAAAFLQCSSTAVYQPNGHHLFAEDDPLGDNHRIWNFLATYSINKIVAEAMARWGASRFQLPTVIARLCVPYGDNGGWPAIHLDMMLGNMAVPVHPDAPNVFNPIHDDDILAMVPKLLAAASVPATVLNWGGSEAVSIEDWCTYLAELTGIEAKFVTTDQTISSVTINPTRMHEFVGHTRVPWREGMERMVRARHPELLKP